MSRDSRHAPRPGPPTPPVADFHMRPGLELETYDARTAQAGAVVAGDVAFYRAMADRCGGPVLELGCGTGRVTWALADAGHEIWGLDLSDEMLRLARAKAARRPAGVVSRVRWLQGDMSAFELDRRFGLIFIPFRAFQALLSVGEQRACLLRVREHLLPGGLAVVDLFDPRFDYLLPGTGPIQAELSPCVHPDTGREVRVRIDARQTDPLTQTFCELWRFTEVDAGGGVLREEAAELRLRWSFRQELAHLFELCGLRVEALHGDFFGGPYTYGGEQVWVLAADRAPERRLG